MKMAVSIPIKYAFVAILMATRCHSWNANSRHINSNCNPNRIQDTNSSQKQQKKQRQNHKIETETEPTRINMRRRFFGSMVAVATAVPLLGSPREATASPNGVVTVRLESPKDSLGVEIYDTTLRGKNVVAIRRIVAPNKSNRFLAEGMVYKPRNGGSYSAKQFSERLRSGPYPLEVDFVNLAAGGDAISDLGTSIVTPKDALDLAQATEDNKSTTERDQEKQQEYSITMLKQTPETCAIRSRRNDVLEIEYEASYVVPGDNGKKVIYDASAFRGTGTRPYQMVLGSGDVIPGVDQGLYDMCPGDKRLLTIPPVLGHGPKSRKLYLIPDNYRNLEWEISLVTIDSTIREDNNVVSRDDRESRVAY